MTCDWHREPDDTMWALHITMLEHAALLAVKMAREFRGRGAGSALNQDALSFMGDLGGRGAGKKPVRHFGPKPRAT